VSDIGARERAEMISGVDVDAVAAIVRSCHFVSDLAAGGPGGPATYLPGRRLDGIAVGDTCVRIQVRTCWAAPAQAVVGEIRAAARAFIGDRTIDVTIADVDDPPAGWPSASARSRGGDDVREPRQPAAGSQPVDPAPAR
jgi:hypothetical protein